MSFFGERDSAAARADKRATEHRAHLTALTMGGHQPPDDEIGVPVPMGPLVLLRNDNVVVAASEAIAFSTGFTLRVSILAREHEFLRRSHPFFARPPDVAGGIDFGVEYADGRRGDATGPFDPRAQLTSPRRVFVLPRGGHGAPQRFDQQLWFHPLPPPGPITLVTRWIDKGLAEQRHTIDAQPILDAAAKSTPQWPRATTTAPLFTPAEVEATLLGLLTSRVAGIVGARIRGILLEGHHPETTLLIAYDRVTAAGSEYRELRGALWHDDTSTPSLTHDSPVEVADLFVRRLRAAAES